MFRAPQAQLTGNVDTRDQELADLRAEVEMLRGVMANSMAAADRLRQTLTPLYESLQLVFGDLDALPQATGGSSTSRPVNTTHSAIWEKWKKDLGGGKYAELIDALLTQPTMTAPQLRVVLRCHINNVYKITAKMQSLGILNKNGGKYSLKDLS